MEASGLTSHLANPMMLQELVAKLPHQIRLNWAIHQRTQAAANLTTFSDWLFEIAEAASTVTNPTFTEPENKTAESSTNRQQQHTYKARSNVHSAEEVKAEEVKMEELPRRKRWERVIEQGLCRLCLTKHSRRDCNSTSVCGKNGCQAKHHPLLHNDAKDQQRTTATNDNANNAHRADGKPLLMRILPVILYAKDKSVRTYAMTLVECMKMDVVLLCTTYVL